MKKKFFIYLLSLIVLSTISYGAISVIYTRSIINGILKTNENDALLQIQEKAEEFQNILYMFNTQLFKKSEEAIAKISEELPTEEIRKSMTRDELKKLAEKYGATEIYLINKNGIVYNTSFPPDQDVNLFTINKEFEDFLKSVYGRGTVVHQNLGISNPTGRLNMWVYYSPKDSDYIVEISMYLKDYIIANFSPTYYDYLYNKFFQAVKKNNKYLLDMDIYHITNIGAWSLVYEGKKFPRDREFITKLQQEGEIKIQEGNITTVYKYAPYKSLDPTIELVSPSYIEYSYDFSILNTFVKKLIIFLSLCSAFIIIIFYFIFSRLFDKYFIKKIIDINKGITQISQGKYDKKIEIAGKDELTNIADNINGMAKNIQEKITKIGELNKELEKKVEKRTGELKEIQGKLLESEKLAALGKMASVIAHELRNPLGVMRLAAYSLGKKLGDKDKEILGHVESIEKKVVESDRIISDMLTFSVDKKPEFESGFVYKSITKGLDAARKQIKEKNVKIIEMLDPKLPQIEADFNQLGEVFANLFLNAAQAMGESKVKELKIISAEKDDSIEIEVSDTGCGIDPENIPKLGQSFFSTKTKGIGLGLYVAYRIIDRHHGSIKVKSEVGKGTSFIITLPKKQK